MNLCNRFSLSLPLLVCAACTTGDLKFDSSDSTPNATSTAPLATSQIDFDMSAQAYDDGVRVYATAHNSGGFGTIVGLGSADHLEATLHGSSVDMTPSGNDYVASFPAIASDADVVIAFKRGGAFAGTFTSTVHVPAQFGVSAAPGTITDGDTVRFRVSAVAPPGAATTLRFGEAPDGTTAAACLDWPNDKTFATTLAADGSILFAAKNAFVRDPEHRLAPDCEAMVGVRFETSGTIDRALGAGSTFAGLREQRFLARLVRVAGN